MSESAVAASVRWWSARADRERLMMGVAGAVLALALGWVVAVQPAWRTLQQAPAQWKALDEQWQAMQVLAAETQALRGTQPVSREQSVAALQAASQRLGAQGRLTLQGERAVLTLDGVPAAELRDWLAEARAGARARPLEATLTRTAQGFSGSVVVAIGGAS
jgi:general secretion pathway protein M